MSESTSRASDRVETAKIMQVFNGFFRGVGFGDNGFFKAVFCRIIEPRMTVGHRPDLSIQANFSKKESLVRE